MITPDDVVVMLSNSGETDELMLLTPHLKRQGAQLIALTGNEHRLARAIGRRASRRGRRCRSVSARTRADGEHDGSTGARRRAGARAARCARVLRRGFRALASGRLARPAAADARSRRDAHRRRRAARAADATLAEAIVEMSGKGMGMTIVTADGGAVAGIFTDGDLRRCLGRGGDPMRRRVADVMTRTPRIDRRRSPRRRLRAADGDAAESDAAASSSTRRARSRVRCTCTISFARGSI